MQEGVLDREGARLHWWLSPGGATAPLVVCTHGGAMDHRMWDPQVSELASQHRVLTHDVRGHGLSSSPASTFSVDAAAEDLIALIDTAGAEKVVLIGHSVGASISQLVALHHPDRVGALIGIGAACITMPATATARVRQAVNPLALGLLGQKRVRAMFAEMAGVTPAVKSYARETIDALDDDAFAAVMQTGFGRTRDVPSDYRLGVPLLLLQGDQEPYSAFLGTTPRWVDRDDARLTIVPSAGHNANQDSPGFVNEQLAAFLSGVAV